MASRGPQLLKDYLASDSNSCSSSGFRSFPRHLQRSSTQGPLHKNATAVNPPVKLTRSRSKAVRFFSIAVKLFPFNTVKSRREESRGDNGNDVVPRGGSGQVKVKDILRWKSFRDLVDEEEEHSPPLDFDDATTTSTGSASSSNASASSWCDSDFTAEEWPCWVGNSGEYLEGKTKRFLAEVGVRGDSDSTVDPEGDLPCEQKEQNSPVSVLNFPIQEDEQSFSPFHQCLQNLERRKNMLLQNLEHFESLSTKPESAKLEDKFNSDCKEYCGDQDDKCVQKGDGNKQKARQMLNHIRRTSSLETREASVDQVLVDFFCDELATSRKQNDATVASGILRVAEDWVSGKYDQESYQWEMVGKREAYVRDMERGERWKKFEEETEELAAEMEAQIFDCLVDELVVNLSCSLKTPKV